VDSSAPLPELLVIVPDSTLLRVAHKKLEKSALDGKLKGGHLAHLVKGIQVYSFSWMATQEGGALS
jgi:hypothetical protein